MVGVLALAGATSAWAGVTDRVAAVVEDEVITLSEIYDLGRDYIDQRCPTRVDSCVTEMELEVLDALIKRVLIKDELDRIQLRVTGVEVDQAIDQIVRENGMVGRQDLRKQLELEGVSWDVFRNDLTEQLRLQRFQQGVLMPRVVVRQDELLDAYQRTARKQQQLEVALDAMGMIIDASADEEGQAAAIATAADVVAQVNDGTLSWDDAVAAHDSAGLSTIVGGRSYTRGELTGAVDDAAFDGEVGVVQGPIQVGSVLFLIRVNERKMGVSGVRPFEEIEEQLRAALFQEKLVGAEEEWYQRARRIRSVEILLGQDRD